MAVSMVVRPAEWNEMFGVWFRVLPDELTGGEHVRVTVHRQDGELWFRADGACAGVHVQTVSPELVDESEFSG